MISTDYCRWMARYNRWQNKSLYGAAGGLDDAARREDRGAFFGSIQGTLSHLLWGDETWMSRLSDGVAPAIALKDSPGYVPEWEVLQRARKALDDRIVAWTETLDDAGLAGDLTWFSGVLGREVSVPRALCVTHFFNHQTHHRGQVHAMLTAAGARPEDTDLFMMPDEA